MSFVLVLLFLASLLFLSSPRSSREPWNPWSERGAVVRASAEIAPENPVRSQHPVRAVERTTRAARGTSSRTTPEELGVAVTGEGLDAQGSRDFCFLWVLCKCVCVAPVW